MRAIARTGTEQFQALIFFRTAFPLAAPNHDLLEGRTMKSPVIKRAIIVDGRKTSISLEEAFWNSLKEIAHAQGATVAQTVTEIDKARQRHNLSSAVRVFVLDCVRNGQTGKQV
jgi:predicted DNA-binding ribbon-helix-helix protein